MLDGNYIIFQCPVGNIDRSCLRLKSTGRWCSVNCIYLPEEIEDIRSYCVGHFKNIQTNNCNDTVEHQIAKFGSPVLIKAQSGYMEYLFLCPDDKYENELFEFLDGMNRSNIADSFITESHSTIQDTSSLQSFMEEFEWI